LVPKSNIPIIGSVAIYKLTPVEFAQAASPYEGLASGAPITFGNVPDITPGTLAVALMTLATLPMSHSSPPSRRRHHPRPCRRVAITRPAVAVAVAEIQSPVGP
ncbi:MAG: hypothetical protein ACRC0L_04775, partial [Angustibacter sp.]